MNRKEVAVGFGWNFLFGLPSKLLFPIFGILIARILGAQEIGVYAVLTSVLSIADIIRDAGLSHTYIADREADSNERERAYATFAVLMSVALAAILFFARYAIAAFFSLPQLAWGLAYVALAIVLNGLQTIPGAKLHRQAKFKEIGITQTSATLISYIVAFVLVSMGMGFEALVWHLLVRTGLQLIFVYSIAPVTLGPLHGGFLRSIIARSASTFTQNLMYSVYTLLDNALVGRLFGASGLGYYSIAWSLGIKPIEFVSFPLSGALFVAYTRFSGDRAKFAGAYCRSLAAATLVCLPLFVFIGVFAREIIFVLYTPKFADSVPLLGLLCVYFAFRSLGTLAGSAMVAAGKPLYNVLAWLAGYAVALTGIALAWGAPRNVVTGSLAGITATPVWGTLTLWGVVAWVTAGAVTAYSLMIASSFAHLRPNRSDLGRIVKAIAAAMPTAVFCLLLKQTDLGDLGMLLIACVAAPAAQLASIGLLYTGKLTGASTIGGLKAVWKEL